MCDVTVGPSLVRKAKNDAHEGYANLVEDLKRYRWSMRSKKRFFMNLEASSLLEGISHGVVGSK